MSFREWLWRSEAIARAKADEPGLSAAAQARVARAQLAAQLADRTLDPIDPLPASGAGLALSTYREAAYWALLAQSDATDPSSLATAFASAPPEVLRYAAGSEDELAQVQRALVEKTFVDTADDEPSVAERDARMARAFVHALIDRQAGPARTLRRHMVERWLRTALLVFGVVAVVLLGYVSVKRATALPDLALGKKWRTSSTFAVCEPAAMRCGGARTAIFFHTNDENEPWFELDLGAVTKFGAVEIDNRTDCCTDRVLPLVLEVSNNQRVWKEIAKQTEPFRSTRIEFRETQARYLRLRVPHRSVLHLERVAVFAR